MILDPSWTKRCEDRFEGVFNKIQIFDPKQLGYKKVVYLDLDVLVQRDCGELFNHETPAAVNRGNRHVAPGSSRAFHTYFRGDGSMGEGWHQRWRHGS